VAFDLLRRCLLPRLCFDECFVECDFFTTGSSVGAAWTGAGRSAGLSFAGAAGVGSSGVFAFVSGAAVPATGATGGAGGVDDFFARPGHSEFENGTFGHDLHTNTPAVAMLPTTTNTPRMRQGPRRFARPASGANSEDDRTFPNHMLKSGVLRRGAFCAACAELPDEISRI